MASALCLGCADVTVIHGVPEAEAHRAVATLLRAGIAAEGLPSGRGFAVVVARGDVPRAVVALHDAELPRREEPGFVEAWGERSLVATDAEERVRTAQSVAGELARSLEALDGVLDARVHVAVPPTDVLGERPSPPTASVLLRHETGALTVTEAQVRMLVAHAVVGLRPENVSVTFVARTPRTRAPEPLVTTFGVLVAARHAPRLRALVFALLGAVTALSVLGTLWLRRRVGR
jgi:type III secretion protein J